MTATVRYGNAAVELVAAGMACVDGVVNTYLLFGSVTPNSICPSVGVDGEPLR